MALTFLAFTDLHHEPQVFPHDAAAFLRTITGRAAAAGADFMVQLGDFLHSPRVNGALADVYARSGLPAYNVFGNHDTDQEDMDYILKMYGLTRAHYFFDRGGYRFIVLDPNYSVVDGALTHYAPRQKRDHHLGQLPPAQLDWLGETIDASPFPCVLFSHQSLERTDGVKNRDEAWAVICEANRKRPHAVILCVNGHYHDDGCAFVNDVCCLDLNSSSYYWIDTEYRGYPPEIYEKYPLAAHCLFYRDPLSALITLEGTARVTVSGASGAFLRPVSRDELLALDQRRLCASRLCVPYISDYQIDLTRRECVRIPRE